MHNNVIPRIRAALDSLRPSERKVAEAVLADVDFAMRASITGLAERSGVSEPSVTRFCRAVECEGLRDLKLKLAGSVSSNIPYATKTVAVDDSIKTLIDKVCDAAVEGIALMRNSLDPTSLEAAIGALASARRIYIFGVGSGSGLVAEDAGFRFLRLDIATNAFSDGHLQRLYAGIMEQGDVAFAISHGGRSVEVNESIQIAKQRGATTIALTNVGTPLAWLVDIPLLLRLPSVADPNTPGVSRLVHLCIVDALAIGVALRIEPVALVKLRAAKANLPREKDNGRSTT